MAIDVETFKTGMRQLAAGVCLITTQNEDGVRSGLTATAVCSVSAEPPLLLVCINQRTGTYQAIRNTGRFAVNVLATEHVDLSNRFASAVTGDERFHHGEWGSLATGAPILADALAAFDCVLTQVSDMGSHGVFFGEVQALALRNAAGTPLLYGDGNYGTLSKL